MRISLILKLTSLVFILSFFGCDSSELESKNVVGGDRDEHGCIPSAGYQWCERLGKCVRPWELEKEQMAAEDSKDFASYCNP